MAGHICSAVHECAASKQRRQRMGTTALFIMLLIEVPRVLFTGRWEAMERLCKLTRDMHISAYPEWIFSWTLTKRGNGANHASAVKRLSLLFTKRHRTQHRNLPVVYDSNHLRVEKIHRCVPQSSTKSFIWKFQAHCADYSKQLLQEQLCGSSLDWPWILSRAHCLCSFRDERLCTPVMSSCH